MVASKTSPRKRAWAAIEIGPRRRRSLISTAMVISTFTSATTCCTTRTTPRRCVHPESPSKHECNPLDFPSLPDHVFRNDAGQFVDVTAASGFVDPNGRGLGVVAADLDGDQPDRPLRRQRYDRELSFSQPGWISFRGDRPLGRRGRQRRRRLQGGNGHRLRRPGRRSACSTWRSPTTSANRRRFTATSARGYFADHSSEIGMAAPTRRLLGFGIAFLDADHDGRLDVLSANGHVLDSRPRIPWTMPLQLLQGSRPERLDRRLGSGRRAVLGHCIWAGGWPPATSTTTAVWMRSSWLRMSRSFTCTTRPNARGTS